MAGVTLRLSVVLSQFIRNSSTLYTAQNVKNLISPATVTQIPHRCSSFRSSKPVADLSEYPEVEIVSNPPEWKYVERLFPPEVVPKPKQKPDYPSGWKPQESLSAGQKYFVARTKNHMVPVYLHVKFRGLRRITVVRHIQGDIWSLEKDLHEVVEASRGGKLVASRVNELSGQIHFHGDHVNLIKDWLVAKGF